MSNTQTQIDPLELELPNNPNNPQLAAAVRRLIVLVQNEYGKSAPHVQELLDQVEDLKKTAKKHPGIARQLTVLHAKAKAAEARQKRFEALLEGLDLDTAGIMKLKLSKQELEQMLGESQALDDLVGEIGTMRQSLTDLESKVDSNYTELKGEIDSTNGKVSGLAHRVFNLESTRSKVALIALIVGLVFAIIAWLVLLPMVFMTADIPLQDGTKIPGVPDPLSNSWGWKLGLAVSLGAIAAGVSYLIGSMVANAMRRREIRKETAPKEQATTPVTRPATPVKSSNVEDETHTRAYDSRTPVGASSGTH